MADVRVETFEKLKAAVRAGQPVEVQAAIKVLVDQADVQWQAYDKLKKRLVEGKILMSDGLP